MKRTPVSPLIDPTRLLATDQQCSVIEMRTGFAGSSYSYTAYGALPWPDVDRPLLGFAGQMQDERTACLTLGNGARFYNPSLRRFHSPDSWSPFGDGGFNSYAYCGADPVNRSDPSGHVISIFRKLWTNPSQEVRLTKYTPSKFDEQLPTATHATTSRRSTANSVLQLHIYRARMRTDSHGRHVSFEEFLESDSSALTSERQASASVTTLASSSSSRHSKSGKELNSQPQKNAATRRFQGRRRNR